MNIYIGAASQISIQEPLSDSWLRQPIWYEQAMVMAQEPNYRNYLQPNVLRRMGKIIRRAMVTSLDALSHAGISIPEAIITGTGLGCIQSTEKFLSAMTREGEECLQPTYFMNSTHNTIASQVAVNLKCQGYNNTHVQDGISFESALLDAVLNFRLGRITTALVGGHDEMTEDYFTLLGKIGYWKQEPVTQKSLREATTDGSFAGETAVSFVLQNSLSDNTLCQLRGVDILHKPNVNQLSATLHKMLSDNGLTLSDIDAVVTGKSGCHSNDAVYTQLTPHLFGKVPQLWYKHIFGESYTAAGLGMYVACTCIAQQTVPQFLRCDDGSEMHEIHNVLIYNHFHNQNHSFILLSSC